jgi:hypothetical protein
MPKVTTPSGVSVGPQEAPQRAASGRATGQGQSRASLPATASVVRCGNALARQASVDAQGLANSNRGQSSEQRHFALAFLARGRSLGIVVWSHDDWDYPICEGRDIRDFYGERLPGWLASPTARARRHRRTGR